MLVLLKGDELIYLPPARVLSSGFEVKPTMTRMGVFFPMRSVYKALLDWCNRDYSSIEELENLNAEVIHLPCGLLITPLGNIIKLVLTYSFGERGGKSAAEVILHQYDTGPGTGFVEVEGDNQHIGAICSLDLDSLEDTADKVIECSVITSNYSKYSISKLLKKHAKYLKKLESSDEV